MKSAIPATMEALIWLGPSQMELQTTAVPTPAANEVLIKVGAVGICGSELSAYLGHNSLRFPPLIMGHEAAGTVVADNDLFDAPGFGGSDTAQSDGAGTKD